MNGSPYYFDDIDLTTTIDHTMSGILENIDYIKSNLHRNRGASRAAEPLLINASACTSTWEVRRTRDRFQASSLRYTSFCYVRHTQKPKALQTLTI
jgi:hypothetical protein